MRQRRHHMGMGHCPRPICCPPNVFPTQVAPAQVSPTQEVVKTNIFNTVVPHYHPVHTTTVNKHMIHNQHYFPQTQSVVNEVFESEENCGTPENPNPSCFPVRRRRRGYY
ncbi:hypothetical protein D1B33_05130 [Lysinibacillus yapensis]|uniref:Spore coat protein D n=1 Tax=Ureibacillus yapensis TaxID=2304605 RepID=A0A396SAW6_9BACL|nr:CotD family spore coat protein [Lysinibacillus yapensis]RHW38272.1 hypothetical protein D1B33_05130 [Lysinibacillus yapensis]